MILKTKNNPKILIIDDDLNVKKSIERVLKREGYELFFADNGEEGLSVFKNVLPVLVTVDLRMPVMDGFEFLKKLQIKPTDPFAVMVITGYGHDAYIEKCYELGVNCFLRKPYSVVEFRCIIKRSIKLKEAEEQIIIKTKKQLNLERDIKDKEMENRLRQADKMASLGTMAAGIAHDVNNPLSVATGDVHLLKRDYRDIQKFISHFLNITLPPDVARAIENFKQDMDLPYILENFDKKLSRCEGAMEKIMEIVRNLKDFSRFDRGEIVDIDLTKEIESSLEMIPQKYKRGIEIMKEFSPLPQIPCYGRQISQVFLNIMVNALQAMSGEGKLKIELSLENEHVYIKFCDTGPGIPEDKIKQIFDAFYTTKSKEEGTGLGLSICSSIIEKHGGNIEVQSEVEQGTTFIIKLPVRRNED